MVDIEQLAYEVFGKMSVRKMTPSIATYNFKLCDAACGLYLPAERALDLSFAHHSLPSTLELKRIFDGFNQIRDTVGESIIIHYQSVVKDDLYGKGVLRLPAIH